MALTASKGIGCVLRVVSEFYVQKGLTGGKKTVCVSEGGS